MTKYKYPFTHYLTFALIMNNEEFCKDIINRIFPEHKVKSVKVKNNITLDSEKTIIAGIDSKQIRLDVMFENDDSIYDLEMQMANEGNIPKRSRYSQGMMDVFSLKPGQPYNDLKKSYVVFICCFDFLKTGSAVSIFEKYSQKDDRYLGDECYTVIVNATSEELGINEGLKNLFNYMLTQEVPEGDEQLRVMDEAIRMHNTGEELAKMMTLEDKMVIEYEKGIEKGLTQGREEGIAQGKAALIIEMRKNGMPLEEIAKYTKISLEEVNSIIADK